jgi:phosphoribosylamine--glycine ligase
MKVLVVGGGGREHALVHAFASSNLATQLYCAPGNAGIAQEAECADRGRDVEELLAFARGEHRPDGRGAGGAARRRHRGRLRGQRPAVSALQAAAQLREQALRQADHGRRGAPTGGYARFTDHRSALDHLAGASYRSS